MNKVWRLSVASLLAAILAVSVTAHAAPKSKPAAKGVQKTITIETLRDKIRGGWAGQMIGVSYGASTEFRALGTTYSAEIIVEPASSALEQDDLYVEMTFAKVMDTVGIDAPAEAYAAAFRDSKYRLWHANAGARRNLVRGIKPPMSGHPKYNAHADDIDFQIEADFIGLMCPGLPQTANKIGNRVGQVMNYGDGVYGGLFVNGMYAAAFFEPTDMEKVVRAGVACLPEKSKYARVIADALQAWQAAPEDWRVAWHKLATKWNDNEDLCPGGAMAALNIDAKLNGAYIALGLLYGGGDMAKTLEISTRCGQDSDCNPANAMGILGVMHGYKALPAQWRGEVESVRDKKFSYTDYSFDEICASTEKRAIAAVKAAGGTLDPTATVLTVNTQQPVPAPLEQWNPGKPISIIKSTDESQWTFTGEWSRDPHTSCPMSTQPGASASFAFEGTGVAILGVMSQAGGRADVYVDGRKHPLTAEAWVPADTFDDDLWRVWNLAPGKHTIKLVIRPDKSPHSTGNKLTLENAVVYKK